MHEQARDPRTLTRADFPELARVSTRWSDNDMFGHLNNAVYYELFDSVLNAWVVRETGVDEAHAPVIGVVAESSCRFYAEVAYPSEVEVGVRVARLGSRSVVFELGLYVVGSPEIAAHGRWAQVYIDAETRASAPIPAVMRALCERTLDAQPG